MKNIHKGAFCTEVPSLRAPPSDDNVFQAISLLHRWFVTILCDCALPCQLQLNSEVEKLKSSAIKMFDVYFEIFSSFISFPGKQSQVRYAFVPNCTFSRFINLLCKGNSYTSTRSKKGKSKSRHTYDVGLLLKMTFGNSSSVDQNL